ncbi:MAG: response regulator [Acidobacteriota bacterium]|nr:response regulator [Acidobacteriota bacterium]
MTELSASRSGMTASEATRLSGQEAMQRLELLATVSQILDQSTGGFSAALDAVAEVCVTDFADLLVIETISHDGGVETASQRTSARHGLTLEPRWTPIGASVAPERRPLLVFRPSSDSPRESADKAPVPTGADGEPGRVAPKPGLAAGLRVLDQVGAQSMVVVPIKGAGIVLGWLVAATGPNRRGFRPSALRVASELAGRVGSAMYAVTVRREMEAAAREQSRTVRRLRRLAAAATNLAGAATTQAVLDTACLEACAIHDAQGAMARWSKADGSTVAASSGQVDRSAAERAFEAVTSGQVARGEGWIAYPLPNTDPWQHGALVVFVSDDMPGEDEPVLSSLASLIPIAFERALGTETALKHEARLRAVVDSSPVALLELDQDGTVASANKRAQALLGWPPDRSGWTLPGDLGDALGALAAEVIESGSLVSRTASAAGRELSLSGARLPPINHSDSSSVLIAGVDLTDIRQAERALIQAQRLDAMGQVAGRVAHDFNNVLTLIIGYASILRKGMGDERQIELITSIEEASRRAATLTQQMLDMTRQRVDTGAVTDLGSAVGGLDAVLARVAGSGVALHIGSGPGPINVRLDPSEIEQIVVNLVINACDAMNRQGRIDVRASTVSPPPEVVREHELPEGTLALLRVTDDGPGMAAEVLSRCVEPFFTTKERGRGTGLGLSTVYGLVKDRGGQMHIDSQVGAGTAISIWLPLQPGPAATAMRADDDRWPEAQTVEGRVVLVEDEDDLRAIAVESLRAIGLDVEAFASAEAALAVLGGPPPGAQADLDVLVTDVMLPQMSGIELVAALRRMDPGAPVIYTTGYTGSQGIPSRPGDPVLTKPYTPDQLRLKVAEVVRAGRLRARSGTRLP